MNRRTFLQRAGAAAILPAVPVPLLALAPAEKMIRISDIVTVKVFGYPYKPWTLGDLYHFLEKIGCRYEVRVEEFGFRCAIKGDFIPEVEEYIHCHRPMGMFVEVRNLETGEVSDGLQRKLMESVR